MRKCDQSRCSPRNFTVKKAVIFFLLFLLIFPSLIIVVFFDDMLKQWVTPNCFLSDEEIRFQELLLARFVHVAKTISSSSSSSVIRSGDFWWLEAGALIGLIREGKLLRHDRDLDVVATPQSRSMIYVAINEQEKTLQNKNEKQQNHDERINYKDFNVYLSERSQQFLAYQRQDTYVLPDLIEISAVALTSSEAHPWPEPKCVERSAAETACRKKKRQEVLRRYFSSSSARFQERNENEYDARKKNKLQRTIASNCRRYFSTTTKRRINNSKATNRHEDLLFSNGDEDEDEEVKRNKHGDDDDDDVDDDDCDMLSDDDNWCCSGVIHRTKFQKRDTDSFVETVTRRLNSAVSILNREFRAADLLPPKLRLLKFRTTSADFVEEILERRGGVKLLNESSSSSSSQVGIMVNVPHNPEAVLDVDYGTDSWRKEIMYKPACYI